MSTIQNFTTYVRGHLPWNSDQDTRESLQGEVLRGLDKFEHAPGETPEARLQHMRERSEQLSSRADAMQWGSIAAFFVGGVVGGGFVLAAPAITLALMAAPAVTFATSFLVSHRASQLEEANRALSPYLKEYQAS